MRNLSTLLCAIYLMTNVVGAQPVELQPRMAQSMSPPLGQFQSSPPLIPFLKNFPSANGSLRDTSSQINPNQPVVLHVQDIHLNKEAQQNLAAITTAMGRVDLIALEGAFAPIATQGVQRYPRAMVRKRICEFLLRKGKLSGPVFAALTDPRITAAVVGIDDRALYNANRDAYVAARPTVARFNSQIANDRRHARQHIHALGNRYLQAFLSTRDRYEAHRLAAGEWASYLSLYVRPSVVVHRFIQATRLEKSINFAEAERQRGLLLTQLSPRLTAQELESLNADAALLRNGQLSHMVFYTHLNRLMSQHGIDSSAFPGFRQYVCYVELSNTIDVSRLFSDLRNMEAGALRLLVRNQDEQKLVHQLRLLSLAAKLIRFELTREEWAEYKYEPYPRLSAFETFYEKAEARDRAMAENLQREITRRHAKSILLVTGGFHSAGMRQALESHGIQVVSATPRVSQIDSDNGSLYLSVFSQQKTPFDQLLAGEKLFLTPEVMVAPVALLGLFAAEATSFEGATAEKVAEEIEPLTADVPVALSVANGVQITETAEQIESIAVEERPFPVIWEGGLHMRPSTSIKAVADLLEKAIPDLRIWITNPQQRIRVVSLLDLLTLVPSESYSLMIKGPARLLEDIFNLFESVRKNPSLNILYLDKDAFAAAVMALVNGDPVPTYQPRVIFEALTSRLTDAGYPQADAERIVGRLWDNPYSDLEDAVDYLGAVCDAVIRLNVHVSDIAELNGLRYLVGVFSRRSKEDLSAILDEIHTPSVLEWIQGYAEIYGMSVDNVRAMQGNSGGVAAFSGAVAVGAGVHAVHEGHSGGWFESFEHTAQIIVVIMAFNGLRKFWKAWKAERTPLRSAQRRYLAAWGKFKPEYQLASGSFLRWVLVDGVLGFLVLVTHVVLHFVGAWLEDFLHWIQYNVGVFWMWTLRSNKKFNSDVQEWRVQQRTVAAVEFRQLASEKRWIEYGSTSVRWGLRLALWRLNPTAEEMSHRIYRLILKANTRKEKLRVSKFYRMFRFGTNIWRNALVDVIVDPKKVVDYNVEADPSIPSSKDYVSVKERALDHLIGDLVMRVEIVGNLHRAEDWNDFVLLRRQLEKTTNPWEFEAILRGISAVLKKIRSSHDESPYGFLDDHHVHPENTSLKAEVGRVIAMCQSVFESSVTSNPQSPMLRSVAARALREIYLPKDMLLEVRQSRLVRSGRHTLHPVFPFVVNEIRSGRHSDLTLDYLLETLEFLVRQEKPNRYNANPGSMDSLVGLLFDIVEHQPTVLVKVSAIRALAELARADNAVEHEHATDNDDEDGLKIVSADRPLADRVAVLLKDVLFTNYSAGVRRAALYGLELAAISHIGKTRGEAIDELMTTMIEFLQTPLARESRLMRNYAIKTLRSLNRRFGGDRPRADVVAAAKEATSVDLWNVGFGPLRLWLRTLRTHDTADIRAGVQYIEVESETAAFELLTKLNQLTRPDGTHVRAVGASIFYTTRDLSVVKNGVITPQLSAQQVLHVIRGYQTGHEVDVRWVDADRSRSPHRKTGLLVPSGNSPLIVVGTPARIREVRQVMDTQTQGLSFLGAFVLDCVDAFLAFRLTILGAPPVEASRLWRRLNARGADINGYRAESTTALRLSQIQSALVQFGESSQQDRRALADKLKQLVQALNPDVRLTIDVDANKAETSLWKEGQVYESYGVEPRDLSENKLIVMSPSGLSTISCVNPPQVALFINGMRSDLSRVSAEVDPHNASHVVLQIRFYESGLWHEIVIRLDHKDRQALTVVLAVAMAIQQAERATRFVLTSDSSNSEQTRPLIERLFEKFRRDGHAVGGVIGFIQIMAASDAPTLSYVLSEIPPHQLLGNGLGLTYQSISALFPPEERWRLAWHWLEDIAAPIKDDLTRLRLESFVFKILGDDPLIPSGQLIEAIGHAIERQRVPSEVPQDVVDVHEILLVGLSEMLRRLPEDPAARNEVQQALYQVLGLPSLPEAISIQIVRLLAETDFSRPGPEIKPDYREFDFMQRPTADRIRLLYVEDDSDIAEAAMQYAFPSDVYDVIWVENGAEALAQLNSGRPFDVIVSDFQMPEMDGPQFFGAVQLSHPEYADRFIFLTSYRPEDVYSKGIPAAVPVVNKSSLQPLKEIVGKILEEHSAKPKIDVLDFIQQAYVYVGHAFAHPTSPIQVAAVVFDFDRTAAIDSIEPIRGENLQEVVRALTSGKRLMLISGSPYTPLVQTRRGVVHSQGPLQRRAAEPIRAALEAIGQVDKMKNLSIHYLGGRGKVTFDEKGHENIQDDNKHQIPTDYEHAMARSLAAAFCAEVKGWNLEQLLTSDLYQRIQAIDQSYDGYLDRIKEFMVSETGFHDVQFDAWDNELVLVFHGDETLKGNHIVTQSSKLMNQMEHRPINGTYTPSGGGGFSKFSLTPKRAVVEAEMATVKAPGMILGFGDSTTDDFLQGDYGRRVFVPVYLGRKGDLTDVVVVHSMEEADNVKSFGFGPILGQFLYAETNGWTWAKWLQVNTPRRAKASDHSRLDVDDLGVRYPAGVPVDAENLDAAVPNAETPVYKPSDHLNSGHLSAVSAGQSS